MFAIIDLSGLGILLILFFLLPLGLLTCGFWIWMLIDAIQNKGLSEGEKIGWVLAIVFLHFVGALIYFFIGRPKRSAAEHRPGTLSA